MICTAPCRIRTESGHRRDSHCVERNGTTTAARDASDCDENSSHAELP